MKSLLYTVISFHSKYSKWFEVIIVVLVYSSLTIITTYPAIKFMNSHLIGGGDSGQNAWNLWWVLRTVKKGSFSFFYTNMLYHPDGVSLAFHTLSPFNALIAIPLQTILNMSLPETINTITLLTLTASGVTTYILVRSLSKNPTAAFVAGLIFTFSPFQMSRVIFGNLNLYCTQFIPLMVWSVMKMGDSYRWRYAIGAAVTLSLTVWCSLELGFGAGILLILLFAFDMFSPGCVIIRLKRWLFIGGLTIVLITPVVFPMIQHYPDFQPESGQRMASISNSADLLGFFIPDKMTNTMINKIAPSFLTQKIEQIYASFYGNRGEKTVFLGYSVLVMVLITLFIKRTWQVKRWLLVAIVFFTLSFGPILHIAGRSCCSFMPYEVFFHIPLLKFGRSPDRLVIFMMLALAIIVGYGLATLERQRHWPKLATILVGALVFAEFLVAPIPLDDRFGNVPEYYYHLSETEERSAVLDIPIDLYGAQGPACEYMIYQTVHHKPIVGGISPERLKKC